MYFTNSIFVIDKLGKPLKPCHPAIARKLQQSGKAKKIRLFPFTIALDKEVEGAVNSNLELRIDPGSKFTGFAIVDLSDNSIIWGMELEHHGIKIKKDLEKRAGYRRGRRSRNTRYRKKRFNRKKQSGWLPPSLKHRVLTTQTWIKRILKYVPISSIAIERVKFDLQKIGNPDIEGVEYQQGTLAGYTLREALLEHWVRECAYCGEKDKPLEIEHIKPKSKRGSDRFSNLTLACHCCNQKKSDMTVDEFLLDKPEVLRKVQSHVKTSLKDVAAVNSTRNAIFQMVKKFGLQVLGGDGASTKMIRVKSELPKEHWIDAGCVATESVVKVKAVQPLRVSSKGHGNRVARRSTKRGFPDITVKKDQKTGKKTVTIIQPKKEYRHISTGDIVLVILTKNRKHTKAGTYVVRVKTPTEKGVEVKIDGHRIGLSSMEGVKPVHRADGYGYHFAPINSTLLLKAVI